MQENADKSRYYSIDASRFDPFMWSERYVLLIDKNQTNGDFHMLQLFDSYNDKSK
jgi:hypothetical protein